MTATTCSAETLVPNQIGASTNATAGERVLEIEDIEAELRLMITKMKYPAMMLAMAALTWSARIFGSKTTQSSACTNAIGSVKRQLRRKSGPSVVKNEICVVIPFVRNVPRPNVKAAKTATNSNTWQRYQ
jgi:hypothetical protein